MGRILSIDYGRKRTGLAVTAPLRIIANGLTTVPTASLITFLKDYIAKENVDLIVVWQPKQLNNQPSERWKYIEPFIRNLKKVFPDMPVELVDE